MKSLSKGKLTDGKTTLDDVTTLVNIIHEDSSQNYRKRYHLTTQATGVATSIWTQQMPATGVWLVRADLLGRGTIGGSGEATFVVYGLCQTVSPGNASITVVPLLTLRTSGAMNGTLSASGTSISATVQDDGAQTMNWSAIIHIQDV